MAGPSLRLIAVPPDGGKAVFREGGSPKIVLCSDMVVSHRQLTRTMHRHDQDAELVLVCDGFGSHTIGGETFLTRAGDLVFHNSGVLHEDDSRSNTDCHTLCCVLSGLHIDGLAPGQLLAPGSRPVVHTGTQFRQMRAMFDMIYEKVRTGDPLDRQIAQDMAAPLVLFAIRLAESQAAADAPERNALVAAMRAYMDEHFAEELRLDDVTRRFSVSPYYACRLFKEAAGVSPMKYLTRRRVGEAQTLLLDTDLSIEQIAERVGYGNPNYFSTVFSRVVGLPPTRYRQACAWPVEA